ncbi:MAG: kinase [Acidimicrobiales bacterium]|nr:kinase [Acidimicrobiales bacterium]
MVATAPVRVCDVGGWTDTWFGGPGRVCNLAVGPGVQVDAWRERRGAGEAPVRLHPVDLDEAYDVWPDVERGWAAPAPGRHPLIEHAVADVVGALDLPDEVRIGIEIRSAVPAGASLGTSAAVLVALVGALQTLLGAEPSPAAVAEQSHRIETGRAGRESGVQDHHAAAHGGAGLLTVDPYPEAHWHRVEVPAAAFDELDARLVTVVVGAHDSSAVHQVVIAAVAAQHREGAASTTGGPARALRDLALLAPAAAGALAAGDIDAWARTLTVATEIQAALHPDLVGRGHRRAIDVARAHGAAGWKVNGAGGAGGSLTIVAPDDAAPLIAALAAVPGWTVPDLHPARRGLAVAPA